MFHDGWLYTGDVGLVSANGSLKIIDRAKSMFKLSQGEYIAPEKLENIYIQSPYAAQVFVYGDSLQNYLVAVVVCEEPTVQKWAKDHGEEDADNAAAHINKDEFKKAIINDFERLAAEFKLTGLEKIKKIHVTLEPFSIEKDILTPTMKIKRFNAKVYFKEQLDAMYVE